MAGCCGQSPVIVNGPAATPRVDVEAVVLCDVLADGTTAATVLLEPVYDTSSGDRVGTRTVDPVTGTTYTPVGRLRPCSPEGCTASTTAHVLCDLQADGTTTAFVRATTYDCDGALLGTLDRTLDGTAPYTVTGTVGVCPTAPDCDAPATPVTSVGLCLADGTPIAVTVVRDCSGAVTSEGWINLTSGAWTAGAVPAGTIACGDSRSITTNGTFCDVDAAGDVVGLVLVEYQYAADGSIDTVRLVDAVTGTTYVPQGTVTTCPVGVQQPEQDVVQLCDVAADGTVTPMIRDYRRDELGAIVGHSDYRLDGTPYTPAGTVGLCEQTTCETLTLCDSSPVPITLTATALPDSVALHYRDVQCTSCAPAINPAGPSLQPLFDGGAAVFPPPSTSPNDGWHWWSAGALATDACACPDATVTLSVSVDFTNDGPQDQQGGGTGLFLFNGDTWVSSQATGATAGVTATLTVSGDVPFEDLAAGRVAVFVMVEGAQNGGFKQWTLSDLQMTAEVDCGQPFLRTLCRDTSGAVVSTTDTLDGTTPYTPVAPVKLCGQPDMRCGDAPPPPDTCARQVIERCGCDDADGDGLGDVQYTELWAVDPCGGDAPQLLGTYEDGDLTKPYTPVSPVECTAADALPGPLSTGVRNVTGTAVQNLRAAFPGLQSVSLTVLAGEVRASMSDGAAVAIPAGVTMTWSVTRVEDSALAAASFAGATAATNYLLNWTYR